MPVNVNQTLRAALAKLCSEQARIGRQVAALEQALRALDGAAPASRATSGQKRKRMSAASRKVLSRKLKAYWAKRKKTAGTKAG